MFPSIDYCGVKQYYRTYYKLQISELVKLNRGEPALHVYNPYEVLLDWCEISLQIGIPKPLYDAKQFCSNSLLVLNFP